MDKQDLIIEINTLDRIKGYLKNYPIETVLTFVNSDIKRLEDSLRKIRKSEYNKAYRVIYEQART